MSVFNDEDQAHALGAHEGLLLECNIGTGFLAFIHISSSRYVNISSPDIAYVCQQPGQLLSVWLHM